MSRSTLEMPSSYATVPPVLLADQAEHVLVLERHRGAGRDEVLVIEEPRGVPEQVAHLDPVRGPGEAGEEAGQRIVERQLSALGQEEHGRGGELLGDRGQPEVGGRGDGRPLFEIGEAESLAVEDLPILRYEHAGPRRIGAVVVLQDRVNLGGNRGSGGDRREEEDHERTRHAVFYPKLIGSAISAREAPRQALSPTVGLRCNKRPTRRMAPLWLAGASGDPIRGRGAARGWRAPTVRVVTLWIHQPSGTTQDPLRVGGQPLPGRTWTYWIHYEEFPGSTYITLPPFPGFAWREAPLSVGWHPPSGPTRLAPGVLCLLAKSEKAPGARKRPGSEEVRRAQHHPAAEGPPAYQADTPTRRVAPLWPLGVKAILEQWPHEKPKKTKHSPTPRSTL